MQNMRLPHETDLIHLLMDIRGAKNPTLSNDGSTLFFLCNSSGTYQLWSCPFGNWEQAQQLTDMPEPISTYSLNPKSDEIIFSIDQGGDERFQLWSYSPGIKPVALNNDLNSIHSWGAWAPDGQSYAYTSNKRHKVHMDVYVVDRATLKETCIYQGSDYYEVVGYTSSGNQLIVRQWTNGPLEQTLFKIDLNTLTLSPIFSESDKTVYGPIRHRKDGTGFYVLTDKLHEYTYIASYNNETHELQPIIISDQHDIESFSLSPDQSKIAFVQNEDGWDQLYIMDLISNEINKVTTMSGVLSTPVWLKNGDGIIVAHEGATKSPDIYHYEFKTQQWTACTDAPKKGVSQASFIEPQLVITNSFDGLEIPMLVYYPAIDRPADGFPVMVYVHGGPASQWKANYRVDIQNLLAAGIMVVAPNVRGSTGYGRTYYELDDVTLRLNSVHDLRAVHSWLINQPEVNKDRIGIAGQSYGGYMVLAALTEQPNLWKLGVDFYGIANFLTMLETTGPWRKSARIPEYGDPIDDKAFLEHISPIRKMHLVSSPLLIVQGLEDPRVPPGESEMVYSVLRGQGKTVEIMRVPHEGHGFTRIDNRRAVFAKTASFIQKYL